MLDRKELTLTLDDFRTIFQLPPATDNNHDQFVPAPTFSKMVPFYINNLGFTLELRSTSNWSSTTVADTMITDEMKLTENYRLYAEVFGIDVPMTQSQPVESTQERHRTTSAPMTPNLIVAQGESSALRKSIVIRLCIPPRRSTRLTPPTPIPTTDEVDDLILKDTLQVSLAEQKSHEELEATQNVEKVKEHLMAKEIEKLVEGSENIEENVVVYSSPLRNDDNQTVLDTRLEPKSDKERLILEREKSQDDVAKMIAEAIQQECQNLRSEISAQVNDAIANHIPSQVDSSVRSYMSGHIMHVHPAKDTTPSTQEQQYQLYLTMKDDPRLQKDDVSIWLALKIKFERLQVATTSCIPSVFCLRDQEDPHDDAHPKGENNAKRQKTSEYGTFEIGGSSSGQDYESKPGPSKSCNQGQSEDFDYWTDSYAIDDDVLPNEKASQDLVNEISQTVDEAKLRKPTPVVQSCQRDPKAPGLPLVNQDLLYLKKGNSGPDKIILSLHKFPAVIFPDDDTEEKCSDRCEKLSTTSQFTTLTITFPVIEKYKMFFIVSEQVYGIIYKNNKKEKRVMRHQEVHKFCDATLKKILGRIKELQQ
ncbi:hypothetical protein Tco_1244339 [Tanacetum coccineum]